MGKKKNQINYWKTLFRLHIFHKTLKAQFSLMMAVTVKLK